MQPQVRLPGGRMDTTTEQKLRDLVRRRVSGNAEQIQRSLKLIAAGNPLAAEPEPARRVARIVAKAGLPKRDAEALSKTIEMMAAGVERAADSPAGAEAIQGPTIDFVGVDFLSLGRLAANSVGRVLFRSGRAQGSGFLVGPGLFLTNHHVMRDEHDAAQMLVEFDYESDTQPVTTFEFDTGRCFVTDPVEGLDFTLVAIGSRRSGSKSIDDFGYITLSDATDKHMLGEIANLIQHPQGAYKQLVLRENSLVARDETEHVLHYLADTEKGSSGSPVCNNRWEPIALHHWGEPWLEVKDGAGRPLRRDVNEGIRISSIVRALRDRRAGLMLPMRETVGALIESWDRAARGGPVAPRNEAAVRPSPAPAPVPATAPGTPGQATLWSVPLTVTVEAELPGGAVRAQSELILDRRAAPSAPRRRERRASAENGLDSRGGYEPGFIPRVLVPLPKTSGVPYRLARNQLAMNGDPPHELRYEHFSIVMNADRKVAAFTACNIDGRRVVAVSREDKTVTEDPSLSQLGVESLEGAEASDDFTRDPRILDSDQMGIEYYEEQEVPGFPKPQFPGRDAPEADRKRYHRAMAQRTARMFQKGHIIMRGDPAWGTHDAALAAEEDTFFYTNAAPQLGYFNQGSPVKRPGAKGKLRWRAVETYVLRNAVTMRQRVSVFAGPIFDDEYDVEYRFGIKVPMRFWKIVVWMGEKKLQSIALLADQKPVLNELTRGVPEAAERFDDDDELARVSEFLSSVEEIESLTKLEFATAVRKADIRRGMERASSSGFTPTALGSC
jgi:endonuclease G